MIEIEVFKMIYKDLNIDKKETPLMRGYFGNKFKNIDYMHNHNGDDKLFYRYPLVQYKTLDKHPMILGIKEGAKAIKSENIFLEDEIRIGDNTFFSQQQCIENQMCLFGETNTLQKYKFTTPWIALNQTNSKKYKQLDEIEKEELLKSIFIGNILSMSKGLGYTVENRLKIKLDLKEIPITLKGNKMIGFVGTFITNFEIPNHFALGKSISRGFGTVEKINLKQGI